MAERQLCKCGCGYPTGQTNGYVQGHLAATEAVAVVTAGQERKAVTIDIVEAGKTMAACRVLGMLPEWIEPGENYGLHVHTYQGLTSVDLAEGGCIVERRGFAKTMQALADHYGATVVVACDPGVGNAVTAKMVGMWEPAPSATDETNELAAKMADLANRALFCGYDLESAARVSDCFGTLAGYDDTCPTHPALRLYYQGDDGCEACVVVQVSTNDGYTPQVWAEIQRKRVEDEARIMAEQAAEVEPVDSFATRMIGRPETILDERLYTADGRDLVHGLDVWDYDLEPATVDLSRLGVDGWFHVQVPSGGFKLMNAERVCVRHPFTGQAASEAIRAVCPEWNPVDPQAIQCIYGCGFTGDLDAVVEHQQLNPKSPFYVEPEEFVSSHDGHLLQYGDTWTFCQTCGVNAETGLTLDQVAARALLDDDQATVNVALEQTFAALAEFTPRGAALIKPPVLTFPATVEAKACSIRAKRKSTKVSRRRNSVKGRK